MKAKSTQQLPATCNDGLDNDGDGLIDSEDDNCIDGSAVSLKIAPMG